MRKEVAISPYAFELRFFNQFLVECTLLELRPNVSCLQAALQLSLASYFPNILPHASQWTTILRKKEELNSPSLYSEAKQIAFLIGTIFQILMFQLKTYPILQTGQPCLASQDKFQSETSFISLMQPLLFLTQQRQTFPLRMKHLSPYIRHLNGFKFYSWSCANFTIKISIRCVQ